ncbi:hypothetical protein [Geodermatophilus ruber]|uniref:Uncharacterized protein n=1 Tax=Geodermatophilus ruber TaxID=504800 RepID=A0A1I4E266_9ACTN|nr:hypothetical protein [Geodermatophilus ruber]SFK99852.1 hypothetical protein SAMN04488085_105188 [Geodermatophilus ruber]
MQSSDQRSDSRADDESRELVLGLIAAPGPATEIAQSLLPELPDRLAERVPNVRWVCRLVSDRLVEPPADPDSVIQAARERLLNEGWHLAVYITDLPLEKDRRPVVAYTSQAQGVAALSLPALGPVDVRRRALRAVVQLVSDLITEFGAGDGHERRPETAQELAKLGRHVEEDQQGVRLLANVITGNFRLLLGMLWANRPWRAVIRLSSVAVGALGLAVLSLVNGFIWMIADGGGLLRLSALTFASIVALVLVLVIGGRLPEQVPRSMDREELPGAREQVVLFNTVTIATVVIGVIALYLILFAATVVVSFLLLPYDQVAAQLRHPASATTLIAISWLCASLATVGGALGASLEKSSRIREVAYTYRPDRELSPHA